MKQNRADGFRCRAGFALIGAVALAIGGAAPSAAAQTQEWYDREFQAGVFGVDDAVDIAYWYHPTTHEAWVYVTGYHTLANGATVFATSRYAPTYTGPGENDPVTVFYPPDPETATGTNRAVAIEVDLDGNVYVTGESTDPTGADGQDIVIIKYTKDLDLDLAWVETSINDDAAIRWDNPIVGGVLNDDRPVAMSLGTREGGQVDPDVIGVTGTTFVGQNSGGDDIVTMLFNRSDGEIYGAPVFKAGSANGNDRPVGIDMYWVAVPDDPDQFHLKVVVAGTLRQMNNGEGNDDIWTAVYNVLGTADWEDIYNGPMNGADTASAMVIGWPQRVVYVSGSTPHYVAGGGGGGGETFADTDYIALGYFLEPSSGTPTPLAHWIDVGLPNVEGVRVFNGPGPSATRSDDVATDISLDANLEIWLTGSVREADGSGYDMATIRYPGIYTPGMQLGPPVQTVYVGSSSTSERAVAMDTNANVSEVAVYVTGTIHAGNQELPLIQTFKVVSGTSTTYAWMRLFGNATSDFPAAIIAARRGVSQNVSVYVFGRSFYYGGTSYDQAGVHYTQP